MKVPYCTVADFESCNEEFHQKKDKKTIKAAEQKPIAYGFHLCRSFDKAQNNIF